MLRYLLLPGLIFVVFTSLRAQNNTVSGTLIDQLNKLPLARASISAVRVRDSVLVGFARSDKQGKFELKGLDTGSYTIQFYYPGFLSNLEELRFTQGKENRTLDTIVMLRQDQILGEVTILDNRAIMIKGDTIQFAADSFKVTEGANVEDLLKKLPGLQVDRKGAITAMGEKVEKVYVDGEEFFGTDPTIATKNIQAKAIKNVQVFDKKSEQAEMTGIDDGNKIKALNLQLKDAYKKGYFGKATSGAGLSPFYYNHSLMAQYYAGVNKFALYGIMSNTGIVGLNWQDKMSYLGGSSAMSVMEGGGVMITYGADDEGGWDGQYNGRGLPESKALGGAYNTKLLKNKLKLSLNYGYSDKKLELDAADYRQQFLPNSFITYDENSEKESTNKSHSGSIKLDYQLDSTTNIVYNTSLYLSKGLSNTNYQQFNRNNESKLLSEVNRNTLVNSDNDRWNNTLNVKKEFKKKGRSIFFMGQYNKAMIEDSVKLKSTNNFYVEQRYENQDQRRIRDNKSAYYNLRLTYNEPLTKKVTLTLGTYRSGGNTNSRINTFEKDTEHGTYSRKIDTLSNDYKYIHGITGGLARLGYKTKTWDINGGTAVEQNGYTLQNLVLDTITKYKAIKWIPNASIAYNFSRSHRIRLSYNGSTNPPRMDQLQPLQDNTDPLNIVTGNPRLKQEYRQSVDIYYNKSKTLSGSYVYASVYGSNTFNSIQANRLVDQSGRTTTTYENVNGNYSFRADGGYFYEINKGFRLQSGLGGTVNKSTSFINNQRAVVNSYSIGPSVGCSYEIEDKLDVGVSYDPEWQFSSGGLIQEKINYYSHRISSDIEYEISKRTKFKTDVEIEQQNPQSSFDQKFERYLWNASISQFLLKNKQLEVKLSVNDILDNNKGFNRYINSQMISENRYNTIRRYAMLSLIYNFKNLDNSNNKDSNG